MTIFDAQTATLGYAFTPASISSIQLEFSHPQEVK
jgi:hypothetical protein